MVTWIQSPFAGATATTTSPGVVQFGTSANIQPDGVLAGGASLLSADAAHVHSEQSWQSNLMMPAGALAEAFPRALATNNRLLSTGVTQITAIALPKGITVTNIVFALNAQAESGGTHAWVALLDSTGKVLAVSADQTGATYFSPAQAAVPTPLGSPYVTPAAGTYYAAVSVTATTPPSMASITEGGNSFAAALAPGLGGTGPTQNAPPAVNATLALTVGVAQYVYAYVS